MFDEEGVVSARHRLGQVPWVPILSITLITAGLYGAPSVTKLCIYVYFIKYDATL